MGYSLQKGWALALRHTSLKDAEGQSMSVPHLQIAPINHLLYIAPLPSL